MMITQVYMFDYLGFNTPCCCFSKYNLCLILPTPIKPSASCKFVLFFDNMDSYWLAFNGNTSSFSLILFQYDMLGLIFLGCHTSSSINFPEIHVCLWLVDWSWQTHPNVMLSEAVINRHFPAQPSCRTSRTSHTGHFAPWYFHPLFVCLVYKIDFSLYNHFTLAILVETKNSTVRICTQRTCHGWKSQKYVVP